MSHWLNPRIVRRPASGDRVSTDWTRLGVGVMREKLNWRRRATEGASELGSRRSSEERDWANWAGRVDMEENDLESEKLDGERR